MKSISLLLPMTSPLSASVKTYGTAPSATMIVRPMAFIVYGKAYQSWGAWQQTVNVRIAAGADRIGVIKSLQKTMEKFTPGHDSNFLLWTK